MNRCSVRGRNCPLTGRVGRSGPPRPAGRVHLTSPSQSSRSSTRVTAWWGGGGGSTAPRFPQLQGLHFFQKGPCPRQVHRLPEGPWMTGRGRVIQVLPEASPQRLGRHSHSHPRDNFSCAGSTGSWERPSHGKRMRSQPVQQQQEYPCCPPLLLPCFPLHIRPPCHIDEQPWPSKWG